MNNIGNWHDDVDMPDSDELLIRRVRDGDAAAYGTLYERHLDAATATANSYARNATDAPDFVAESFANVLAAIQNGNGPTVFFRAYLLTTLRRLATAKRAADRRQVTVDDLESVMEVEAAQDPVVVSFEKDVVGRSFKDLPERWQAVLWYTEVDGLSPAAISPMLGISANAVAALAVRAREGLKQAYLQNHISTASDGCAEYSKRLGAYARGGLTRGRATKVEAHLETCLKCTSLLLHIQDVGVGMRAVIFPAVVGLAYTGAGATKIVGLGAGLGTLSGTPGSGASTAGTGGAVAASAVGVALAGALVAVALVLSGSGPVKDEPGLATVENSAIKPPTVDMPRPGPVSLPPTTSSISFTDGELPEVVITTGVPDQPFNVYAAQPTKVPVPSPGFPSPVASEPPPSDIPLPAPEPSTSPAPESTLPVTSEPTPSATSQPTSSVTPAPTTAPTASAAASPSVEPTGSPATDLTPFSARGKVLEMNVLDTTLQIDLMNSGSNLKHPTVTFTNPKLWTGQSVSVTAPAEWICVDSSTNFTAGSTCTAPAWATPEARFLVSVMTPIALDGYFVKIDASADGAEKYRAWLRSK